MTDAPPRRIETANLVIRCWSEGDAPLLRSAIDSSLDHLRAWMPWAMHEPSSLEQTRDRLAGFAASFESGEDFVYGIFNRDESSRRIPERLGYRLVERRSADTLDPEGSPRDTLVFELSGASP